MLNVNLPPYCHVFLPYITSSNIKWSIKESTTRARMHHVVIIVINYMLTFCYSMMSHATIILCYHASMLTLHSSLVLHAHWLLCWGTTFGTKDLRTLLRWISAFIMIYYYLINKF